MYRPLIAIALLSASLHSLARTPEEAREQLRGSLDRIHARMYIADYVNSTSLQFSRTAPFNNYQAVSECVNRYTSARDALQIQFSQVVAAAKVKALREPDENYLDEEIASAAALEDSANMISSTSRSCLAMQRMRVDILTQTAIEQYAKRQRPES